MEVKDLFQFMLNWQTVNETPYSAPDFNADGSVDSADLYLLLWQWQHNYSDVIDNSDSKVELGGLWHIDNTSPDKYGTDARYAWVEDIEPATATWTFEIEWPGYYNVFEWHPAGDNRASDAPFTIHSSEGLMLVRVDQRVDGGKWNKLGRFHFDKGTAAVVLTDNSNDKDLVKNIYVFADAIKLTWSGKQE